LSCGTEDVQPLCEVPLHLHNEAEEVIFCYAGQGLAVVGEEQREFTPGLMVLIPRGIPHKFVNTSSSEVLKFTWTLSPPQTIQQFAAKSTN
jgi:mannose-6-phosphate isomerase-like protein (cupin superfamily)